MSQQNSGYMPVSSRWQVALASVCVSLSGVDSVVITDLCAPVAALGFYTAFLPTPCLTRPLTSTQCSAAPKFRPGRILLTQI